MAAQQSYCCTLTSPSGSLTRPGLDPLERGRVLESKLPKEALGDRPCALNCVCCTSSVALFSHCASLSCSSPLSCRICGRSAGILTEERLEFREPRSKCSNCDKRLSPRTRDGEVAADVSEGDLERRKRLRRLRDEDPSPCACSGSRSGFADG